MAPERKPGEDHVQQPIKIGKPQAPLSHTDSGNSGNSTTTEGGPGTAGSVQQTKPGAPAGGA